MLAKELISEVVPALRTSDTGQQALSLMEVFKVTHLPIVNREEFLGLISDNDIYDLNMPNEPLGNHPLSLPTAFVNEQEHVYQIISQFHGLKLSVVPVVDHEHKYLGVVTQQDLVNYFARLLAVENPGGIIILEMNVHDYSASEITYIVEANDAKVLSMYLTSPAESTRIQITIKTNKQDIAPIVQAFGRHNYTISATFSKENSLDELNEDRFEAFMKYLNI